MKKGLAVILIFASIMVFSGCGTTSTQDVEGAINEAFGMRAEVVFKHQDQEALKEFYTDEALEQSKAFLEWSPRGQWENVKDIKYSYSIRIKNLKINGKEATAEVYDTAVISWDYVDPNRVLGTEFTKEDAWANRKHEIIIRQNIEGKWMIEQDITE